MEWELTQRKQLAALCDELTESKKAVAASIDTKQTRLDNLAPQLRSILEVVVYYFSKILLSSVCTVRKFNFSHFHAGKQTVAREPWIATR